MPPTLILVGGFLGAGKTTLIVRAAELLLRQGVRAAVITNDQDTGLVDTQFTEAHSIPTREVAGACFCCRFGDLLDAAGRLREYSPEVIFAEPVGSCVDLSATILQPLKAYHAADYHLAPLSVLVDPAMASSVLRGETDENIAYLFRQQIAEADLVCLTKADREFRCPELPFPPDFELSALTGYGLPAWLAAVRSASGPAGTRLLDVDYGRYAEAEAALGWVNVQADVALSVSLSPASLAGPLAAEIAGQLSQDGIAIAHLKISDRCATGFLKVSVCRNGEEPQPDGDLAASPAPRHQVSVNLRALGAPVRLAGIVKRALAQVPGEVAILHAGAFRPAPPKPEHHFTKL